jgi:hypothetical protein
MIGNDGTIASLKQLYGEAGLLAPGALLSTEVAFDLDDAEAITGRSWHVFDRIGMDVETPAPNAEALTRLISDIVGARVWRAPEGS